MGSLGLPSRVKYGEKDDNLRAFSPGKSRCSLFVYRPLRRWGLIDEGKAAGESSILKKPTSNNRSEGVTTQLV